MDHALSPSFRPALTGGWGRTDRSNMAPTATFIVYQDKVGKWRWQLKSSNGTDILGDSGQGYATESYCRHMIDWIKANAHSFAVVPGSLSEERSPSKRSERRAARRPCWRAALNSGPPSAITRWQSAQRRPCGHSASWYGMPSSAFRPLCSCRTGGLLVRNFQSSPLPSQCGRRGRRHSAARSSWRRRCLSVTSSGLRSGTPIERRNSFW
jgi:uncharacterized protein YegP (UPF0339 family)